MDNVARAGWPADAEFAPTGTPFRYSVYGLQVESEVRLSLTDDPFETPADVRLCVADRAVLEIASAAAMLMPDGEAWYRHAFLNDGRVYLHWEGLFEFVVSPDGRRVWMASVGAKTMESFQAHLLGHALGFALTLMGEEPLHATVIEAAGKCVGLLGSCGSGKSTLAAYLLGGGASLLTDDLLRVTFQGTHAVPHPGPHRIKVLPDAKERFLREAAWGVEMDPGSRKYVVPLPGKMTHVNGATLEAVFVLDWPSEGQSESVVNEMTAREAFLSVIAGTFNQRLTDSRRLERQFRFSERLVRTVPVRRLVYAREFGRLPEVARLMGLA